MINQKVHDGLVWRNIGPFRGGRSVAVAGDPDARSTFFMGTTGGGVWKSIDAGTYWRNVSDGFFGRASVGALAVAESDPNVIYVGMGETTIRGNVSHGDGVYRSTDAGETWTHLGLAETRGIGKVRIHPHDPDRVYVAAFGHAHGQNPDRGVYRSSDGGATWDQVLFVSNDAGANDLVIDPRNPRIIYSSFWEARRTPYDLTSGGPGCKLFKSLDGGDTWADLTEKPGMPKGLIGKIGITVSPARSGRIWALIEHEDGGVFRSDDAGETWERLCEERNLRQRAWYYSHIIGDPGDEDTVWVLNVEMFKSVDAGKTFQVIPAPHGDNHDLWIDPKDPQRMILGNDGGGTISFTGGNSWTSQYSQPTAEFYHVTTDTRTPYRVYGSQQDNTSMSVPSRSDYGSITVTEWYAVGGGEAGYIAVRPDNPDVVYAGEYMGILTRYDHAARQVRIISVWPEELSGSGAEDYRYRFQWTYPIHISHHDPNVLYCAGNHIFRTTDEGTSWETVSPDLTRNDPSKLGPSGGEITKDNTGAEVYCTIFAMAESPLDPDVIWAGSDDGLVHVTRNGGKDWTNVTPPQLPEWSLVSIIEASPHNPGTAYVAANRYKLDDFAPYLFVTRDYGKSWAAVANGIEEVDFVRVVREDPETEGLLFAGTETGMYVSYTDGETWERLSGNLPVVPVHDLTIKEDDLVLSTHGRAFWILDDMTIFRQIAADYTTEQSIRLFEPRPTTRFTSIGSFGHSPVKGQNFTFSETQVPGYDYDVTDDGQVEIHYLNAGENPPDGVLINYVLAESPTDIKLSILDANGNEIRTFKPKPDDEKQDGETFPPEDKRDDDETKDIYITKRQGLNRFVWNMRIADVQPITIKGGDKASRSGPRVLPGTYQVRLKVGDWESTKPFEIRKDPRSSASARTLKSQYDFLIKIHDKHDQVNQAINDIRKIRREAVQRARWAKTNDEQEIVGAARTLSERLDEIESALMQTKIVSEQDSLNFPVRLNGKLAALAAMVESGDEAPTKQSRALYDELAGKIDAQLKAFAGARKTELSQLNALLKKSKSSAIS